MMNRIIMARHKLGSSDDVIQRLAVALADSLVPGLPIHIKNNVA